MAAGLEWSEFWSFLRGTGSYSSEIERQLDLPHFLPCLSIKTQLEVLNTAPVPVVKSLQESIHPEVFKELVGSIDTVSKQDKLIEWSLSSVDIERLRRKQNENRPKPKTRRW